MLKMFVFYAAQKLKLKTVRYNCTTVVHVIPCQPSGVKCSDTLEHTDRCIDDTEYE